MILRLLSNF